MAVEREDTTDFLHTGKTAVERAMRAAAGHWSVQFHLQYTLTLNDGRQVRVDRHVIVRATEQLGRKQPRMETAVDCPKCGYKLPSIAHFEHCGHGHVVKRHDGMLTRCGGPLMCNVCAAEKAAINQPEPEN